MAPGSRSSSRLSQPLPMIIEDVVHSTTPPPGVPPKSPRRPPVSRSNSQSSIHSSHRSRTPPPFGVGPPVPGSGSVRPPSIFSTTAEGTNKAEVTQQETAEGAQRRDQGPVARKGWYRAMLGSLLVVGVIVGLSVGLTIGLRKRNQQSQSTPDDYTSNLFPVGSYNFTTALLPNVSTSCLTLSSFSTAWQCYISFPPSSQQQQQQQQQQQRQQQLTTSVFHWTITPSPRTNSLYTISSSPSPRIGNNSEPQFQNLTLTTLDVNQYTERLTFSLIYPKPVSLSIPVGNSTGMEERVKCWFNTTILSATIYTRQRATWPESVEGTNATEITGREGREGEERVWPFLVEVSERQVGNDVEEGEVEEVVPDCYFGNGTQVVDLGMLLLGGGGNNGTGTSGGGEGECGCWYRNFELANSGGNGTVPDRLRGR
ncbi:hypothetical protein QBC36DRAFT_205349 [Triangularia setosa]|uniref:Uncharacterized protein n=1 Tax=Triangularia setosa TaxID=2587417 RepID=A0AAN6WDQ9_9PEZI|nr:hypothetical protein QBC36DRAFT_205349 [Podospora setosa]